MTRRFYQIAKSSRRFRVWLMAGALLFGYVSANIGYALAADSASNQAAGSIIINEVRSGKGSNTILPIQYVTLYNTTDSDITVDGWTLEFAKQPANCSDTDWKVSGQYATDLFGVLKAHTASAPIEAFTITDGVAGAVHLSDTTKVQDLVSWGWGAASAPCPETVGAPDLKVGSSLQRYVGCLSHLPIDTDNNADDFWLNAMPAPGTVGTAIAPQCASTPAPTPSPSPSPTPEPGPAPTPQPSPTQSPSPAPNPSPDPTPSPSPAPTPAPTPTPTPTPTPAPITQPNCQGITITELLPNPAGTDGSHEFIELHNPTDEIIDLLGCSLQTSASTTKSYTFGETVMQPDTFQTFYDSITDLTLPNASGGTVWLLSNDEELQAVMYPADPEDNTVWAFVDGAWATSYTATPGAYNTLTAVKPCDDGQVRNIETNRCVAATTSTTSSDDSGLTPCDSGQIRNQETNRCRTIVTASAATAACPAGQVRNPDTNRCKAAATAAATTLASCKEGQERNPETNRCRNIATATAGKACPAGQVRNAETNRCRKATAAGSSDGKKLDGVKDVASSPAAKNKPYWLIAGALLVGILGYAIYEWRQEIRSIFTRRFVKPKPVYQT